VSAVYLILLVLAVCWTAVGVYAGVLVWLTWREQRLTDACQREAWARARAAEWTA
jgi:hypothetical protein